MTFIKGGNRNRAGRKGAASKKASAAKPQDGTQQINTKNSASKAKSKKNKKTKTAEGAQALFDEIAMEDREECFDNGEGGDSDDDDDDDGPGVTFRTEDYEGMGGGHVAAGDKGAQKG